MELDCTDDLAREPRLVDVACVGALCCRCGVANEKNSMAVREVGTVDDRQLRSDPLQGMVDVL